MRDLPIRAMARSHATEKRKMVRPAGFEPATLGLEGRCREIPLSVSARRLWGFFAVRINPSLSDRPRSGSLWSLMPPTPDTVSAVRRKCSRTRFSDYRPPQDRY